MTIRTLTITFLYSILLYGCSSGELELSKNNHKVAKAKIEFEKKEPIYIKIHKKNDEFLLKKVVVSAINTSLFSAIGYATPDLTVSPDSDVKLTTKINVKFNGTLRKYFEYLSNLSGYHIELIDKTIHVKSIQEKTWQLQSLSLDDVISSDVISSDVSGDGSSDVWSETIENLKRLLGADSIVVDNKQLGTITAIALPEKIKRADAWLSELIKSSNMQVHLKVQILDITVDESVGQGIDWNLVYKDYNLSNTINSATGALDSAGALAFNAGSKNKLISLGGNIGLSTMIRLLRKQGKVTLDNQPNITISNGRTANISTGDKFSYIGSTEVTTDDDSGKTTYTTNVERIKVGVSMKVTPKILKNGRIAINVVPTISSLKGFTTLSTPGVAGGEAATFKTPNVALQSLATQVIIPSGETIHLGGLIAEKLSDSVKGLPESNALGFLFNGATKSLERREIVILITPTIIDI